MTDLTLRFRQVHLDFHTSEQIAHIGADFDPQEFAATLERACVNSITCFARGHHGWIYYENEVYPERRHPHLTCDLLREQIEACHARDIRVPIYITVQWDHYTANEHPEWLIVDEQGCPVGTPIYEAGFYRRLCLNSPYVDFLRAHVQEVCETMPVDGIFFDIVAPQDCSCSTCRAGMIAQGLEPSSQDDRLTYGLAVEQRFKREMTEFVHQFHPDATVFYNAGHIGSLHRQSQEAYTHFELESLPSGGWGYMHFPIAMRYARTLGLDCMGMTGKFHTSWGDFHSFKNEPALQFECFQMLALGAKCSIGDQLHPRGQIDPHVYDLIGSVYAEVEEKEPWCTGAQPVSEIAVFTPEEFAGPSDERLPPSSIGVARMLEEGGHQFDFVDSVSDLGVYKVVILPDLIPVDADLGQKLADYVAAGGALIASFESGMDGERSAFALDVLGVELAEGAVSDASIRGEPFAQNDYVEYVLPRADSSIGEGLYPTEYAMYMKGVAVSAKPGSDVLADVVSSYFDRSYRHFCSHRQTPSSGAFASPAIVRSGHTIYFSQPIFKQYNQNAPRWCKQLFLNALDILLPDPIVRHAGPTTVRVTVNAQPADQRWIVHLLHYIPERRGQDFDVIEDVIPLFDLPLSVRAPAPVEEVVLAPQGEALEFALEEGRVTFAVPVLKAHQMVELRFAE